MLLPPQNTSAKREWGYATADYFTPDYDLGMPEGNATPTANTDLVNLVRLCHSKRIRLSPTFVMAFSHDPYARISYNAFHIDPAAEKDSPDGRQRCTR
jgi:pullulanase